ncbi:MAG TPA: c-type cytochrome [Acetobacteraceae bacterium]|nr:c-type cytochrome [Acetobacteraceae bacterium]
MKTAKAVVLTIVAVLLVAAAAGAATIYAGAYNVAATEPHWSITYRIMDTARVRSIKAHAAGIVVPAGFDDQAKVVAAVDHFAAHCAVCHGSPGGDRGDLAAGMYPRPPDLTNVSKRYTPAELFWILKNGIKMSGMPSMADDGDDLLWATVGLLEKLPGMTPDDYNDLWMASQAAGGQHHPMHMGQHPTPMGGMDMHGAHDAEEDGQPGAGGQTRAPPVRQTGGAQHGNP